MASTLAESLFAPAVTTFSNPKPAGRVCFSYAAYAKNIIDHLSFPPDLSSILREGLSPWAPAFPTGDRRRLSSLRFKTNLPVLGWSNRRCGGLAWIAGTMISPIFNDLASTFIIQPPPVFD
nr:uncharacterized protein LOC107858624 [Ipomoea batatas]